MKKQQFRFNTQYFKVDSVSNVPAFIVCSGHGYSFHTFCCKYCGELYIAQEETSNDNRNVPDVDSDSTCVKCQALLKDSLVTYPENIFHNGVILKNTQLIVRKVFEDTFLKEVYVIKLANCG